jgi:hypothetical protein
MNPIRLSVGGWLTIALSFSIPIMYERNVCEMISEMSIKIKCFEPFFMIFSPVPGRRYSACVVCWHPLRSRYSILRNTISMKIWFADMPIRTRRCQIQL